MERTSLHRRSLRLSIPGLGKSLQVDDGLKVLVGFAAILMLLMQNGVYLLGGLVLLMLIIRKFWKPYQPSIFLFCFIFQWFQVLAFVLWMNVMDLEIDQLFKKSSLAVIESMVGLALMVLVIRYVIRKYFRFSLADLKAAARQWDARKILVLYLVSTLFLGSIGFVLGQRSGLAQVLITLQSMKWVFFLIYGFILWSTGGKKNIFWVICVFEFFSSLYSYFSDFKQVIFYLILILMSFTVRISIRQFASILAFVVFLGFFFITWSAIKGEYRDYLSSGERKQIVTVSREDAYKKITDQLSQLDAEKYSRAVRFSLYRAQYILHIAKVMERIPAFRPHEDGNLWLSNVTYVLTPRALNPDKEIFDPSVKTNKYTGMKYATGKMGAAFSLGYFAESYVDFGHILMFIPLVLLALFVGWIYVFFMSMKKLNLLARFAIATTVIFPFISFESDGTFLLGRLYIGTVVMFLFAKLLFPLIQEWAFAQKRY